MYSRRIFRRHAARPPEESGKRRSGGALVFLVIALVLAFLTSASFFLKSLSSRIAVSDACDVVTAQVNSTIAQIMAEGGYDGDCFVTFEKNDQGEVTAISSNMARINALSAQILDEVIDTAESRTLTITIPAGNLTGMSLLMGRGPAVPVQIIALTSSHVEFENSIVTAGINQTKHQITLSVIVDIDVLIPWGTESTQVLTQVLIADTVVVGHVPETYLSLQQN